MFDVFVNYRQADARFGAAAVYELLAGRLGRQRVFLDNQSIEPGSVYPRKLREALEAMRVLLVLIGPQWLAPDSRSPRRPLIHDEGDWVRREIRRAFERAVPVVPVLLDGVQLPGPELLPAEIRPLVLRQAAEVRHHRLGVDVGKLADLLIDLIPGVVPAARNQRPAATERLAVDSEWPVVPRQLPADCGQFIGRVDELAALDAALRQNTATATPVVVSGTAGVGKTALVVRWAYMSVDSFPDGQLFVDLRGYDDEQPLTPSHALSVVLRALGVAFPDELGSIDERAARYRTLLSTRRVLIILDNARSVPQVAPLVPGTGRSALVITSRHMLSGLTVRYSAERIPVSPLSRAEGVALLGTSAGHNVVHDPDAAAELVSQCAGLPLALRIAAERIGSRPRASLTRVVAELADETARLDLLDTEDTRTSVRAVLAWSYQGLNERDALTFRMLGLHPGWGCDSSSIAALLGHPVSAANASLHALTSANLVSEIGADRYQLHDLLRVYARELTTGVDTAAERLDALTRLFDYFLHTAEHADRLLTPHRVRIPLDGDTSLGLAVDDAAAAVRWLEREHRNLVALCGLDYPALDNRRWQLAYALRGYFYLAKHLDSWLETHTKALRAAERAGNLRAQATTHNNLGMAVLAQGHLDDAEHHYETARNLFELVADQHGVSNSLANLAIVLRRKGDHKTALANQHQALAFYRSEGLQRNTGITLRSMARVELELRWDTAALRSGQEAVDIAVHLGQHLDAAEAFNVLGLAAQSTGDITRAEEAFRRAVAYSRRCGSTHEHARAAQRLGFLLNDLDRRPEAVHWMQVALHLYRQMGSDHADTVTTQLKAWDSHADPGTADRPVDHP